MGIGDKERVLLTALCLRKGNATGGRRAAGSDIRLPRRVPGEDSVSTVDDLVRFAAEAQAPPTGGGGTSPTAGPAYRRGGGDSAPPGPDGRAAGLRAPELQVGARVRDPGSKAPYRTGTSSSRAFGHFGQRTVEEWTRFTDAVLA
ncbi:hypothetical protein GCM10023083_43900 [Streptomyces phyllanthi]